MEDEVGGEYPAERAGGDQVADGLHARGEAVGQVDAEKPVADAGSGDDGGGLGGGAAERLLAEDGDAAGQRGDRLTGVQRGRRRDDEAVEVEVEEGLEAGDPFRVRGERAGLGQHGGRGIADRDRVDLAGGQHRLHAVPADPADSEEPDAGAGQSKVTSALRKPSGRSRVASSASPSRSSG